MQDYIAIYISLEEERFDHQFEKVLNFILIFLLRVFMYVVFKSEYYILVISLSILHVSLKKLSFYTTLTSYKKFL